MRKVLLIRYGEIHLKGQNRPFFIRMLAEDIKNALQGLGATVTRAQGRFYVENYPVELEDEAIDRLTRIFGIYSVSPAREVEKDWAAVCQNAAQMMAEETASRGGSCTFKVFARRSDKTFPLTSMQIAPELGGYLLEHVPGLSVDVHEPDVPLGVEIREHAYLYTGEIPGSGGMPAGSNGRAALLLSGGIDSPVAGHMVMKRGVEIECIHFHSFPYTSERARDKVVSLTRLLSRYSGSIRLHIVHFTDVQMAIYEACPDSQTTILIRRAMMRIAERIAAANECRALVTGEAIGQVASQTLESLCATDSVVGMPVFRPCIGFDKSEIMERARKIGTYETSILPYEDCCTIFTPKHPVTHPRLRDIEASERKLTNYEELLQGAIGRTETLLVTP